MSSHPQDFYTKAGLLTTAGKYSSVCALLLDDLPSLCKIIQTTTIHISWAEEGDLIIRTTPIRSANTLC
jgi:hypothetical protein